jgi:hypothetical protein
MANLSPMTRTLLRCFVSFPRSYGLSVGRGGG